MFKTCFKCNVSKPLSEYYKHPQMSDGYLGKCKDCTKRDVAENRSNKKEHYLQYDRKRYRANGHRYSVPKAQWNAEWKRETGKGIEYNNRYRGMKVQALGTFTAEEFVWLCIDYNYQCLDCGSYDKFLTADHVIPLSLGGDNTIGNIQPLCGSCNSRKGTKVIDYRREALEV